MGKNSESFKIELNEIRSFLAEKKQLPILAERAGVTVRTVYNTFNEQSFDDLKGDRLNVYREAIKLVEEIKNLPLKAKNLFNEAVNS